MASDIDAGEADGAKIVLDIRTLLADGGVDGFWLGPTLLDNVTPQMSVYTDESCSARVNVRSTGYPR